jgi:hypothetical protein
MYTHSEILIKDYIVNIKLLFGTDGQTIEALYLYHKPGIIL